MLENKTKIHVNELRLGMFVSELDIPWRQSPFSIDTEGFVIQNREQLAQLRDCSTFVYIDVDKQKRQFGAIPTELTKPTDTVAFKKAFSQASKSYQASSKMVQDVMNDLRFGNQLNSAVAKQAVSDCVNKVLDNSDTMHLLTQLRNVDDYTTQHCLNVSILSILFGKFLKLSNEKLNVLGMCGLLHDVGKSKIPLEIINKTEELTALEKKIKENHTILGQEILQNSSGIDAEAIEVAHAHHEWLDGSGYPRGISGDALSFFTKMVAIVDTYDALTSDKPNQKGKLHLEAIEVLVNQRRAHYDDKLVVQFIECIGIYPVGNPVEMTNGEVAMVIESNPKDRAKPKVLLLLDALKRPRSYKYIDLSRPSALDERGKPYKLYKVIRHDSYGLNLPELHEMGVIQDSV